MPKEEIVEKKEVTVYEIIKIGPSIENFDDRKRQTVLRGCFGPYLKFYQGPPMDSMEFPKMLHEKIQECEDLIAIEVSPGLDSIEIKRVIENCLSTPVIQPQFSGSAYVRYVSFHVSELIIRPMDLLISNAQN